MENKVGPEWDEKEEEEEVFKPFPMEHDAVG